MGGNHAEYLERTYRNNILKNNLKTFNVTICETDLFISSDTDLNSVAYSSAYHHRSLIEAYIKSHPAFLASLLPVPRDEFAPAIVRDMIDAAFQANVGPMASVAGAIAEHVGKDLLENSRDVIIENGGDIFINAQSDIHVGIFAGTSPFSNKILLHVNRNEMPVGVCTSSRTVGHSLSFGKADAVCVKAKSVSLADAAATSVGNKVKTIKDIAYALKEGMKIKNVQGVIIIMEDKLGVVGDMEVLEW